MTSVFAVDAGTLAAVFRADGGALTAGFVAVAVGAAADAGLLIARLAGGLTAGLARAFAAGFVAAFAAGFAALGAASAALRAAFAAALAPADLVVFGALDRVDLRLGAVADRRRVAPDPDPVDVSSAIAFSSCALGSLSTSAPLTWRRRRLTAR